MSDLPSLEQPQAYVVVGPNDQRGPYTLELLVNEVVADRLPDTTPVWWPGLADWTTMDAHPGVAAEIRARRAANNAWAAPAAPAPAAEPVAYQQPAAPQQSADPFAAQTPVEPTPADQYSADQYSADQYSTPAAAATGAVAPEPAAPEASQDTDIVDAVVVDPGQVAPTTDSVDAAGQSVPESASQPAMDAESPTPAAAADSAPRAALDPEHAAAYADLVRRSGAHAVLHGRVAAIDESVVSTVIEAAAAQGLTLSDQVDVDRSHELRFDAAGGGLLVMSLGEVHAARPDLLSVEHLPMTVSYRSGDYQGGFGAASGEHGDIAVISDEWTGQATSTVSLFLPLADYLDDDLAVERSSLGRDVGAAIAAVRHRLS